MKYNLSFYPIETFVESDDRDYNTNIYNEPLEPCGTPEMSRGSWDNEYKCSERGGGVHQICLNNISKTIPGFSKLTGQSDWSDNRGDDNHCVCLGAWSLYNTKHIIEDNAVKCDAIPKAVLSNRYTSKFSQGWNKWNGLELSNQIKDGVESLVENCYKNDTKSQNLINNYCDFAKKNETLKDTEVYNKYCS